MSNALSHARLTELPQQAEKGNNDWSKAIVLVRKANNRTNYAVAYNDGEGGATVVADFGPAFVIREILAIYPYARKDLLYRPVFKTKEDIVIYLTEHGCKRKEIEALMSEKYINQKPKSEERMEQDRKKIKALLERFYIVDQNTVKNANERAYKTAFADKDLPDLPADEDGKPAGSEGTTEVTNEKTEEDEF